VRPTDFAKSLKDFLTCYLPGEKGSCKNTVASYKDTFILFLTFLKERKNIPAERLMLSLITKEMVVEFLDWLEDARHCCAATRNVRLAALHSFFQYLQYRYPEQMPEWHRILAIPVKKTAHGTLNYLSVTGIRILLEGPDQSNSSGRRDLALLSLLYNSGARVQEIIDLTPSQVRLESPCTVKLIGKGNKARIVPLLEQQVKFLKIYMAENKLFEPYANQYPLFCNRQKKKLTRAGANYILGKYANVARMKEPLLIPEQLSCHCLRHSLAMHLLQAGVNLVYIRDILGHTSVQVTEIYARTDSRQKREAIEKAYTDVSPKDTPSWLSNSDLMDWLKSFNK